jgi:hypothetical protein
LIFLVKKDVEDYYTQMLACGVFFDEVLLKPAHRKEWNSKFPKTSQPRSHATEAFRHP